MRGLESRSSRPHRLRTPSTPAEYTHLVCKLRRANPEYSKYKLQVILARDHGLVLSASTIGRIITRYNLFFARPIKPKGVRTRIARTRRPTTLIPSLPGDLIEVDVKHLPALGNKQYAFVATDVVSKQTTIHVASTISSRQGAVAWAKACKLFKSVPKAVLTDNGSENLGKFADCLRAAKTPHYFARPRSPKDKPFVERAIGTLERECIQWGGLATDLADQQDIIDTWLKKYHNYRPHQSLGYLTPDEFRAKLDSEVALRY